MDQNPISTAQVKKTPINEQLQKLSSNEKGLSASEAKARFQHYGYNEIAEKKAPAIAKDRQVVIKFALCLVDLGARQ